MTQLYRGPAELNGERKPSLGPAEPTSFRDLLNEGRLLRVAGAHNALSAVLVEEAGFDGVWASSFEISAARCLPDASLLTMTDYLAAAEQMQASCGIPVVADVDTGFGGTMNVAHMVQQYERAKITAVCIEDKVFPKINSFVPTAHTLVSVDEFCQKIEVAKSVQHTEEFCVIARTEALIDGLGVQEALSRCQWYAEAGADAVLVHSKAKSNSDILAFLRAWNGRVPVVIVPTTYPDWDAADAHRCGVAVIVYANQSLRAAVASMRQTLHVIQESGSSAPVEERIAPISEIFELQRLDRWREIAA